MFTSFRFVVLGAVTAVAIGLGSQAGVVRAQSGPVAEDCCDLDWCCGPSWYAYGEALWLQRDTGNTIVLAEERTGGGAPVSFLTSNAADFDYEPGARIVFGHYTSDCSAWELAFMGFQDWNDTAQLPIDVANTFSSFSPVLFEPGNAQPVNLFQADFATRLYGAEMNARHIFLDGNASVMLGVRYLYLHDELTVSAANANLFESTNIDARNDLIGAQLGAERSLQLGRLSLDAFLKAGLFLNFNQQSMLDTDLTVAPIAGPNPIRVNRDDVGLSGIIEAGISGKAWLTDHIWIRGGYQVFVVDGVALAPEQIPLLGESTRFSTPVTNANIPGDVNDSGTIIMDGFFAGFGIQW